MNSCHPASNTKGHLVPSCVIVFFWFLFEQSLAQARFEQGVKSRDCCRNSAMGNLLSTASSSRESPMDELMRPWGVSVCDI